MPVAVSSRILVSRRYGRTMAMLGSETAVQSSFSNGSTTTTLRRTSWFGSTLTIWIGGGTVSRKGLDRTYPGVRLTGPTDHPWGREVNLIDLAGVCWHI